VFDLAYLQTIGMMKQDEFVAVPMFILMGYICDQAGLPRAIVHRHSRPVRASARLALPRRCLLTGDALRHRRRDGRRTVVLLGIMAGPMMIKSGYDVRHVGGRDRRRRHVGILIPPSVMLVVMGPVLGVSVAKLYEAACGPGFMLAGMYILYTMGRSFINPKLGPPVPVEDRPKR
jgi:TRAP-type mannitol/chloroaromatic compound transport system permease large subunit